MQAPREARQLRKKTGVRAFHRAVREAHPPKTVLAFLLQDLEDGYNVGALFRLADAVGAVEIVATGQTPGPESPTVAVTSLGQHRRVPFRRIASHEEAARALADEGWTLVAVEIADGARPYHEHGYAARTCLVLGNERTGVYQAVMRRCEAAVYVPMHGKGRSMNVSVSAAVVAYRAVLG